MSKILTPLQNWRGLYNRKQNQMYLDFRKNYRKRNRQLTLESEDLFPSVNSYFYQKNKLLGPWEGAKKVITLAQEILSKNKITTSRMTAEDTQNEINQIIANDVIPTKYDVTDRKDKKTTTTTTEKTKVIKLDKEIRHGFEVEEKLLIEINEECWDKMQCWIDMTPKEISGLGCVRQEKNGSFRVYDVFLFEQENTFSFTDIDDLAVQKLMVELDEMDDKDGGTRFKDMKFWWHSHGNFKVDWSSQDEFNIQEKLFGENIKDKPVCPWWLSVVLNKRGEINTRLDIAEPWLTLERMSYHISHEIKPEIEKFCKAEYDKKVTEKDFTQTNNNYANKQYDYSNHNYKNKTDVTNVTSIVQKDKEINRLALIPHPTQANYITQLDTEGAFKLWEVEIIEGMAWIYSLILKHGFTNPTFPSIGFRPTKIEGINTKKRYDPDLKQEYEIDEAYEWTLAGTVKRGDYLLTIWPGGNSVYLDKILDITEVDNKDKRVSLKSRNVLNDRFAKVGLTLDKNWEPHYTNVVGVVFRTTSVIPQELLGDTYLWEEEYTEDLKDTKNIENWGDNEQWEQEWETSQEKKQIEIKTKDKNITQAKAEVEITKDSESIEKQKDLFDEMIEYASATHRREILSRIEKWISKLDHSCMVDIVEALSTDLNENLDDACPEACMTGASQNMTDKELFDLIMDLALMDHINAFAQIPLIVPHRYYCPGCYEIIDKEVSQCPECKIYLTW